MTRRLVISHYPLTNRYLEQLSQQVGGELEELVVSNITAKGYLAVMSRLWTTRADVAYIPVLDESGRVTQPLLQILSLFVRTPRRVLVDPHFAMEAFGYGRGISRLVSLMLESLQGWSVLPFIGRQHRRLLAAPRHVSFDNGIRRVLYLKTNLWLGLRAGGSLAHTAGVVSSLLRHGIAVDYVSVEAPVGLNDESGLSIKLMRPTRHYMIPRELNYYLFSRDYYENIRHHYRLGCRFLYQRMSPGDITGVLVSRRRGLPLVLEYNGSEVWLAENWGKPLVFRAMAESAEEICLRHASVITTVSDILKNDLIARGVEPERIVSYPNGVDPEMFDPSRYDEEEIKAVRRSFGIPEDAVVAAFVGTFGHWHGVEVLAEALRHLVEFHRPWLKRNKLHILFIGDGAKRSQVEGILADGDAASFATLTGLVPQGEIARYLAAADILVSPHIPNPDGSPFFGSPTKLFEYMAMERPVIASDLFQIGEVMQGSPHVSELRQDGKTVPAEACGVLVEPKSVEELAEAIRFLADRPDWCRGAGRNARRRVLARYTWDHHVEAILDGLDRAFALDAAQEPQPDETRPVRVLLNALHSKSGGGVTYLRNILPIMAAAPNVDIHVCIHESQSDLIPSATEGVTVHALSFASGFWRLLVREQIEVPRLAKRIGADVTFSPANYGPLFAPNPVILLRNALSVASVERRPAKMAYWMLLWVATRLSLAWSRRAMMVSNYALRSVGGFMGSDTMAKISLVPHGITPAFAPRPEGNERQNFLLCVSDVYVQKNFHTLIRAVGRLRADYPEICLKIAGKPLDNQYFNHLKDLIRSEGLEDNIEFLGHQGQDSLLELYRSCRVFVFPSTVETFGNPLVEAMASGAPVACSDTAAMPEVAGDAALYFEPTDVKEMADVIARLLSDAELRDELGRKALERGRQFSWEATARKTLEVLRLAARRSEA